MRRCASLGFIPVCLFLCACGDDGAPAIQHDGGVDAPAADGPKADAAPEDTAPADAGPDAAPSLGVGQDCPTGTECPGDLICLDETMNEYLSPDGYCSLTCTEDEECGGDAFCSPPFGTGPGFCFERCAQDGTCARPGRVCSDNFLGADLGRPACIPGNPDAIDGAACAGVKDCNAGQMCVMNPYEMPGGECITYNCTVGDNGTCAAGGDGVCIDVGEATICVDSCTATSECREAEGYTCASMPGAGVQVCIYQHAAAGSACSLDTSCGPVDSPWRCLSGAAFPGGYCTGPLGYCDSQDTNTCPFETVCYDPDPDTADDQYCVASCTQSTDCRTGDGYDCLPLDPAQPTGPKGCMVP